MAQLRCENLALGYEGKEILSGLSFQVNRGDYLCIVGENGSGKSTLMKTILGLHAPLAGTITTGDGLVQNQIGYLPQQTMGQRDFPASVYEIVLSGCQGRKGLRPFYSKQDKALAWANIDRMNIRTLARRCYRELSGGQQQRVLLARALCATRSMLLLDEPVSGLDPRVTARMGPTGVSIITSRSSGLPWYSARLEVAGRLPRETMSLYCSCESASGFRYSCGYSSARWRKKAS